jgi:hypothetical protein
MEHDPKWEKTHWFDGLKSYDQLRIMQMESGPRQVYTHEQLFCGEMRHLLLKYVSLMFMVPGAGKTTQIIATLLAINDTVNRYTDNGQRCASVLWFVNDVDLTKQLSLELRSDITNFNLHTDSPTLQICSEPGDLERGPNGCAITISCPHALWKKSNQSRTDEKIMEILSQYDTIIWDECDFAPDQISRLVRLSPHALKFGLTATPINADGKFLKDHFVLAGYATYRQVYETDRCLKYVPAWDEAIAAGYVKPISYGSHSRYEAGKETNIIGGKHRDNSSLPGAMAMLRQMVEDISALEGEMRRLWPDDWFSPHGLVVCRSRAEADHLQRQINAYMNERKNDLVGHGWRATVMYDNYKADKREEKNMFHNTSTLVHPFMRAKRNNGRCDEQSARIHIVVKIGVRGMNNWPILFIGDVSRGESVNTQVQLKGRDLRLPPHLSKMVGTTMFERFCSGRYYYPDSGGSSGTMQQAYDFILNDAIEDAEFITWDDLMSGESLDDMHEPQGTESPFTFTDRIHVDEALGYLAVQGVPITPDHVESIIGCLPPVMTDPRRKRVLQHVERIMTDERYRKKFAATTVPEESVIRPIAREEPKEVDDYSVEELAEFVIAGQKYGDDTNQIVESLSINPLMRRVIAIEKRSHDARRFRPVPRLYQLQKTSDGRAGLLTTIADKMRSDLIKAEIINSDAVYIGLVRSAVNVATSRLCGMSSDDHATRNFPRGALDNPYYHHQFGRPQVVHKIKELAVAFLVHWGHLPNLARLYSAEDSDASAA